MVVSKITSGYSPSLVSQEISWMFKLVLDDASNSGAKACVKQTQAAEHLADLDAAGPRFAPPNPLLAGPLHAAKTSLSIRLSRQLSNGRNGAVFEILALVFCQEFGDKGHSRRHQLRQLIKTSPCR
jgi:hypothetical protein